MTKILVKVRGVRTKADGTRPEAKPEPASPPNWSSPKQFDSSMFQEGRGCEQLDACTGRSLKVDPVGTGRP